MIAMASKHGGGRLAGDGADHDADRAAQRRGRDGAQRAGAAEHDGRVGAVGEHEGAQVVGRADGVDQRRAQHLGDDEQRDGDDRAVDDQGRPAGAADPAGEQRAGDQRRGGADEAARTSSTPKPSNSGPGKAAGQHWAAMNMTAPTADDPPRAGGLRRPCARVSRNIVQAELAATAPRTSSSHCMPVPSGALNGHGERQAEQAERHGPADLAGNAAQCGHDGIAGDSPGQEPRWRDPPRQSTQASQAPSASCSASSGRAKT